MLERFKRQDGRDELDHKDLSFPGDPRVQHVVRHHLGKLTSGKKPSVKTTMSALDGAARLSCLGGPNSISLIHCRSDCSRALPRGMTYSLDRPMNFAGLKYCLSEIAKRKALPTLPQRWEAANMSFPLSLPAGQARGGQHRGSIEFLRGAPPFCLL